MIDLNKITRYKMSLNGTVLEEDPRGELVFFSDVEEAINTNNMREVTTLGGEHIGFIEDEFSNIDEETFNRIAKDMKGK